MSAKAYQVTRQVNKIQASLEFDEADLDVEAAIIQHCVHDDILDDRGAQKAAERDSATYNEPNRMAKVIYKIVPNSSNLAIRGKLKSTNELNEEVWKDEEFKLVSAEDLELEPNDLLLQSVITRWLGLEDGDSDNKDNRLRKLKLMVNRLPVMLEEIHHDIDSIVDESILNKAYSSEAKSGENKRKLGA